MSDGGASPKAKSASAVRGLTPEDLLALPLEQLTRIVQALAVESDNRVVQVIPRGTHSDLRLSWQVLGQEKSVLVRVREAASSIADLNELADDALRLDALGHLLVGRADDDPALTTSGSYLPADVLVAQIEASYLMAWSGRIPSADPDLYTSHRDWDTPFAELDPSGLRWLRPLSLNKLPVGLRHSGTPAHTWFEVAVYRVATRILALRGRPLGAGKLGQREPDGYFVCPGEEHLTLFDAKAARDGWEMDANEERKLLSYMPKIRNWYGNAQSSHRMVVVSSTFTSEASFETRQRNFAAQGYLLAYLPVESLLRIAHVISSQEDGPEVARWVDWPRLLSNGLVTPELATAAVEEAVEAQREAIDREPDATDTEPGREDRLHGDQ